MVIREDIVKALRDLGIQNGDIVLVHSSLKSFGYVDGGALTVIEAFMEAVGAEGTLVFPTLSQKNFEHALEDWSMDRPSDVGLITETFRKLPNVERSNQETHSVAAWGKYAHELTCEHKGYGPLYGPFTEWAFSASSPWQKMYRMNAKVVFVGVDLNANTFKHLVEYKLVNEVLDGLSGERREEAKNRLYNPIGGKNPNIVWPFFSGVKMHPELEKRGLIRHAQCGDSAFMALNVKEECDAIEAILRADPESWYPPEAMQWFRDYQKQD